MDDQQQQPAAGDDPPVEEGHSHVMAIGFYIGGILAGIGAILVVYGLVGPTGPTDRSLGFDLNTAWGAIMVVGGGLAVVWSWLARRGGHRAGRVTG